MSLAFTDPEQELAVVHCSAAQSNMPTTVHTACKQLARCRRERKIACAWLLFEDCCLLLNNVNSI